MRYFIPIVFFTALVFFFLKGLKNDPHHIPSALIGKPVPQFQLTSLMHPDLQLNAKVFKGKVSLLHVWATWCVTCRTDHLMWMDIIRSKKIVLYGLNYKDNHDDAKNWLKQYGNPYQDVISDPKGKLGIDLGVYGTPETFLIDKQGMIRYKYIGPISPDIWEHEFLPKIQKYQTTP